MRGTRLRCCARPDPGRTQHSSSRCTAVADLAQAKHLLETESDADLRELAREELKALDEQRVEAEQAIKLLLLPKDDPRLKHGQVVSLSTSKGLSESAATE